MPTPLGYKLITFQRDGQSVEYFGLAPECKSAYKNMSHPRPLPRGQMEYSGSKPDAPTLVVNYVEDEAPRLSELLGYLDSFLQSGESQNLKSRFKKILVLWSTSAQDFLKNIKEAFKDLTGDYKVLNLLDASLNPGNENEPFYCSRGFDLPSILVDEKLSIKMHANDLCNILQNSTPFDDEIYGSRVSAYDTQDLGKALLKKREHGLHFAQVGKLSGKNYGDKAPKLIFDAFLLWLDGKQAEANQLT